MKKYDSDLFYDKLVSKLQDGKFPACPFCGCDEYATEVSYANILTDDRLGRASLDSSIPSGILICQNCGHMDYFVLGILGAL